MSKYNLITVLGPTASGKTLFGANLSTALDGEIISADSRQIYRDMDLGTGKDYGDYVVDEKIIPVHLIDIHEAGYKYNLFEFQSDFKRVFEDIGARGKIPIMVGGTGMYIEAILNKYELVRVPVNQALRDSLKDKTQDKLVEILVEFGIKLHNSTDLKVKKTTIRAIEIAEYYSKNTIQSDDSPEIKSLIFGVKYDRDSRRKRITERLKARLDEGMIDEVKTLLTKVNREDLIYYGLEYKFLTLYLTGELSYQEMFQKLEVAIHQFAKRQMTWFRRMERNGFNIRWMDGYLPLEEKLVKALNIIKIEAPELIEKL
jgi:tRNA dimethylallyltransferase